MATLRVALTQPESLWCLKMEGPALYRDEMEPPTPTTPSTKLQQSHQKPRQHTYQRNAACTPKTIRYSTRLQCKGHCMSSLLTRDARKSFRRCLDIKLVCITSPASKSLNTIASCYLGCPNGEAVAGKICLQSPQWRKFTAANQSGLSMTEVDHLQVGTRGEGHFLVRRVKPAVPELQREVPFPDQYGCGNPDEMDPFLKLLFEHRDRLATGANPLRCLPPIDE